MPPALYKWLTWGKVSRQGASLAHPKPQAARFVYPWQWTATMGHP